MSRMSDALHRAGDWLRKLFGNPDRVLWIILLFLALFFFATGRVHAAERYTVEGGTTYLHGAAPVAILSTAFDSGIDTHGIDDALDYEVGLILIGAQDETRQNMGVHASLVGSRGAGFAGLGFIYLQHEDRLNSGGLNFFLQLGVRLSDRWRVHIRHISNAGTASPNIGRDFIGFSYTLRRRSPPGLEHFSTAAGDVRESLRLPGDGLLLTRHRTEGAP